MSGEDVELRDLLMQTLEINGQLSKLRAQLRSNIFKTLNEDSKTGKNLINDKLKAYYDKSEGQAMFYIVKEFLEYMGLECTLSVFEEESLLRNHCNVEKQQEIIKNLGLEKNNQEPALLKLLKNFSKENVSPIENTPVKLNSTYEVNSPTVFVQDKDESPKTFEAADREITENKTFKIDDSVEETSLKVDENRSRSPILNLEEQNDPKDESSVDSFKDANLNSEENLNSNKLNENSQHPQNDSV